MNARVIGGSLLLSFPLPGGKGSGITCCKKVAQSRMLGYNPDYEQFDRPGNRKK